LTCQVLRNVKQPSSENALATTDVRTVAAGNWTKRTEPYGVFRLGNSGRTVSQSGKLKPNLRKQAKDNKETNAKPPGLSTPRQLISEIFNLGVEARDCRPRRGKNKIGDRETGIV